MGVRCRAGLVAVVLAAVPSPVGAALHEVLGRALVVKDPKPGVDPTRRRIVATAKEKESAATLAGDPTVTGGVLVVGAGLVEQVMPLPAAGWRAGKNGFGYRDRTGAHGPVKAAVVRRSARGTFSMKAVVAGKLGTVDVVPPNPGSEGAMAIAFAAGDTYCAHYGGVAAGLVKNAGATLFRVTKPTAVGPCPSSVVPTTTSSTTTTPTTTTTTTTGVPIPCGEVVGSPLCWGACPPEAPICVDVGGVCQCTPGSAPCGGTDLGAACDGACPPGEVCISGGIDCHCLPAGAPPCLAPGGGPACGGFCPPDETCEFIDFPDATGCLCAPPTCFSAATCGGPCPPGRTCRSTFLPGIGTSCLCLE